MKRYTIVESERCFHVEVDERERLTRRWRLTENGVTLAQGRSLLDLLAFFAGDRAITATLRKEARR